MESTSTSEKGLIRPLLTVQDVARILGCGTRRVFEMVEQDEIPSIKHGRLRRFREQDIQAWIDSQVHVPEHPRTPLGR